jgi:putative ABC transport system ATP-binding protein|tara:strand:+ start:1542 stop:2243 length:702 start_codon:yes stop_codon:yes gene_type:complete
MSYSTPFLAARNVSQIVANPQTTLANDLHILQDVDFTIEAGESVAIVGASGSGKTTLLGMMAGLDSPSHGQLFLAHKDLTQLNEEGRADLRKHQVSFIFQNFQLLPSLTALENIMLPLEVKGTRNASTLAQQYLTHVGLAQRGHHYPNQLSGGEQQRVAIARAFAAQAPILFADEPTGNLDTQTGDHIIELLFELNQQHHTTLVLVTHDLQLAQRCQRRLTLNAGKLTEHGHA